MQKFDNLSMKMNKMTNMIRNMPFAKKLAVCMVMIFALCCLKLCASDMTSAEAQVAREKFVTEAKKYVGCPYVLGGIGPDSFDCSGLVYYSARQSIQKQLPRTAKALYSYCRVVPDNKKEVGDLLFFKTNNSGAAVTHVGIYIGHNQFISAISDGPNTGVIISSLNQAYWKPKYVACGQFLKSGKTDGQSYAVEWEEEEVFAEEEGGSNSAGTSGSKTGGKSGSTNGSSKDGSAKHSAGIFDGSFDLDNVIFDSSIFCDWSLFSPQSFMINWRGIDIHANARYSKWPLQPGVGVNLRFNYGAGNVQLPVVLSATLNDYFRVYAGPVFTFGYSNMVETGEPIKASIFPGTLGVTFATPSFKISNAKVQIVQDVSYNVFNKTDNSALSFVDSVSAGLLFCTGVRVSLDMRHLKRGKNEN